MRIEIVRILKLVNSSLNMKMELKNHLLLNAHDSIEIETLEGKTDTASIRWVNDCEYICKITSQKYG
jgi:hypothetical protein